MIFSTLEHILTHISFSTVSILITIHLITFFVDEIVKLYDSSEKGMITTFLCITGLLISRWIYSKHFPLSDLYESLIFLSWSFSFIYIVPYFRKNQNLLSTIIGPSAIFSQGFATSGLLTEIHESKILVPALQSEWLIMHVSMMILGYVALLCGSLLSVSLLVITVRKNRKFFSTSNPLLNLNKSFFLGKVEYINEGKNILKKTSFFSPSNYYKSQLIQQLDYWSYRVISLGFLFLTIGILSGAVWANEAWGSYWSWDPKETWAFITWIIFAIYLHTQTNLKLKGTNSAIVAFIGFLIIWICYFGVNLLGIGLHSYGSFTLTSN
uniref:Cytochrome c biogenesis protein CcsA n=2 Tax=Clerodendranthus spicatus TaxID=516067 RepID=A0A8E8P8H5_9LAMI|nr:cytochrome c heme attachment protein [Clerodendranthus spicatus]YP_010948838.1 cytochrome c biogenesis protein [Orthosiphon aristatus]YP_011004548.1 cytochrome c biogenesis protein [Orthosiphon aristatus var. aristatus]QTX95021.1 cytochrome c biogenesis protein [Clerodendranthus spicatus]QWE36215.1 cytochrome c heme attachment protein [Clerodendranthus spicatus]UQV94286.1 cytochrome c heme attachment protein [Clerodendranthus spicatus]WMV70410.1 cytochrome c biogenesis protein [Orthosiphon